MLHFKCEFAVNHHLGIGICFNRSDLYYTKLSLIQANEGPAILEKENVHLWVTTIKMRANYHFLNSKIIDPYIGISTGIRRIRADAPDGRIKFSDPGARFGFEGTLGLRVLIKSRFGFYGELALVVRFFKAVYA